ncbi:hypothetical protein JCM19992_18870 [Thermostilla marina]
MLYPQAIAICVVFAAIAIQPCSAESTAASNASKRPYELVWANRTTDTRPPLIDFETCNDWKVTTSDAEAQWSRSDEQPIWERFVGKLVYRGTGNQPSITVSPPEPISFAGPVDAVNLWVYGNNWAWNPDPTTPPVSLRLLLEDSDGKGLEIDLGTVHWKEWWLVHRRLDEATQSRLTRGGSVVGLRISGGRNRAERTLYFDNLAIYREKLGPLQFEQRPKRGIDPFPGQSPGLNTGPGRLPFPTREWTLLPDNEAATFKNHAEANKGDTSPEWTFRHVGSDGTLVYTYRPASGTLGDITARWNDGDPIRPMVDGGVYVAAADGAPTLPDNPHLVDTTFDGTVLAATWKAVVDKTELRWTYHIQIRQKTLIVDVAAPGGYVREVRFGRWHGNAACQIVTLPYLTCDEQRPAVVIEQCDEGPLFGFGIVDYYRSNASELFAINDTQEDGTTYNGGVRYLPKTDGNRNDCYERLFLTISPKFEEVLPNVPNPKSPWKQVTGSVVWRSHGAGDRMQDWQFWRRIVRYGMRHLLVTDHETGWRDGGESFTLRTQAAPGKGGDEGQRWYADNIRALGIRYGLYNNYTDFAPVNAFWNEDHVTRLPTGEWRTAWPRCYNLKPSRAVELEARLAPIIQEKFHLNTGYCDVHTAVRPWQYCDYDARVPGAGTFAATYYAYGELLLHQKEVWNGPVYSEGNNHWYYCGLADGNYGQDQLARLDVNPWLVDFDLRKLHPLCCNFGMGNLGMFFGKGKGLGQSPEERQARLDRFLAATLAFGHTGFLVTEGGIPTAAQSYYAIQQPATHYATAEVTSIRYHDGHGNLLDSSEAVASGAYTRSQLVVRYDNGLIVRVNGHPTESWTIDKAVLPPNGWFISYDPEVRQEAVEKDDENMIRRTSLIAWSAVHEGHRTDYVDSPEYLYANARGKYTRFPKLATDGQLAVVYLPDDRVEVIPIADCSEIAIWLEGKDAIVSAVDEAGNILGQTSTRFSRGLVHIDPFPGAFSYLAAPEPPVGTPLRCRDYDVVPGQVVTVTGEKEHTLRLPRNVEPGAPRWMIVEQHWLDFRVRPIVEATPVLDDDRVVLHVRSNLPQETDAVAEINGEEFAVRLAPDETSELAVPLAPRNLPTRLPLDFTLHTEQADYTRRWSIVTEYRRERLPFPEIWQTCGECVRSRVPTALDAASGAVVAKRDVSCGQVMRPAFFMHPPYKQGVGFVYADFGPIELPGGYSMRFRSEIGKGDGSDPGDGILFQLYAAESTSDGKPLGDFEIIGEQLQTDHTWSRFEVDLDRLRGKRVLLRLAADVGPSDDSTGDWAAWTDLHLESSSPVLIRRIAAQDDRPAQVPGPHGVSEERLREVLISPAKEITKAVLHFQAIGIEGTPAYPLLLTINDQPSGTLPSVHGDETVGRWDDGALELPPEVVATLRSWNTVELSNPAGDCYKIRNVWIECETSAGQISSWITRTVKSQPPSWRYAAGELVGEGLPIRYDILFAPFPSPTRAD